MLIIEALGALQFLKKELISLSDLGQVLGLGRAAMSGRCQRNSELKPEEIQKLEAHFGVSLSDFCAQPSKQDKKELAELIKETLIEMILEKGGQELLNKLLK